MVPPDRAGENPAARHLTKGVEMSCCCVEIDAGDGPKAGTYDSRFVAARKKYKCVECSKTIHPGETYLRDSGVWDDRWVVYHTCETCGRVRKDRVDCGWYYGHMWEDIAACLEWDAETRTNDRSWIHPMFEDS